MRWLGRKGTEMAEFKENVIEWYTGEKWMSVTLTQKKHINRVRKLVEKYADMGCWLIENRDGSVWARIPLSALHLTIYGSNNRAFPDSGEEEDDEIAEEMEEYGLHTNDDI